MVGIESRSKRAKKKKHNEKDMAAVTNNNDDTEQEWWRWRGEVAVPAAVEWGQRDCDPQGPDRLQGKEGYDARKCFLYVALGFLLLILVVVFFFFLGGVFVLGFWFGVAVPWERERRGGLVFFFLNQNDVVSVLTSAVVSPVVLCSLCK